jgi:predicted ATPase
VKAVRPRNIQGNLVELFIWPHETWTERLDLAVPLAKCGTGVGQLLAIFYVIVTADQPRVIIIDEPQSFLHPGAVRKLLEVLSEYPYHQFIRLS